MTKEGCYCWKDPIDETPKRIGYSGLPPVLPSRSKELTLVLSGLLFPLWTRPRVSIDHIVNVCEVHGVK
jgi:hypothetical protein